MSFIEEDEYIYVKPKSISNDVCDYLIKLFEHDASHLVRTGVTGGNVTSSIKQTSDLKLNGINNYDTYLFEELTSNITKYFKTIYDKYGGVVSMFRNITDSGYHIQKYVAGKGVFEYHDDMDVKVYNTRIQTRIVAFIWYLNTVEHGGETEFFNGKIKIKPEKGKLLIFPATWTYLHKGCVPLSEDKYIVTGWIYENI